MPKLEPYIDTQFNLDEIYSVSDFLSLCNSTIENNIPTCWLKGEISNLSRPVSGHWYFSLKDKQGQIRCALFRLNQRHVRFIPEDGIEVLVQASPTIYEARGDFQLVILRIEPMGTGNLQLAFEQLKTRLRNQGLFDAKHKKPLPTVVNTIGVISSSSGAVIQDIIKVLNQRYPFAKILLYDCIVQGQGAAEKLSQALYAADKSGCCDVLILARGGGSLEDLWAFNEEILAKAIFAIDTPIISAIGHETDITIADFVADKRAHTPSSAAMIATPDRLELLTKLNKLHADLLHLIQQILYHYHHQLKQLSLRTPKINQQLNMFSQMLDNLSSSLNYDMKTTLNLHQNKLNILFEKLKKHSPNAKIQHQKALIQLTKTQLFNNIKHAIDKNQATLSNLGQSLEKSVQSTLEQHQNKLSINITGLNHLSPLNTLSRGYSISMLENNRVLNSTAKVKVGTSITTLLSDGKICSKIKKVKRNTKNNFSY